MGKTLKLMNGSLARRMTLYVILASTLFAIFASGIQIYLEFQRDIRGVHAGLAQIEQTHLSNIASRVWVLDTEELQTTLDGLLSLPYIQYIAASDNDTLFMSAGIDTDHNVIVSQYPLNYELNNKTVPIGKLIVKASLDEAYQHVIDRAVIIIVTNAIKTLFVAGLILLIFYRLIAQHLIRTAEFAEQLNIDTLGSIFEFNRKKNLPGQQDELDLIKTGLSNMQQSLAGAIKSLKDSRSRVHLLLDSTAEAIFGIDNDGNCTFVNQACLDMLGYEDNSELLNRKILELIHHSYADGTHCPVETSHIFQAIRVKQAAHIDNEVMWRKDGSCFAAEYWAHPIFKENECIGAVVTFLDITSRVEAFKALQDREQNLDITLNSIGDAVITTDVKGNVVRMNPVAEQLTGWSLKEATGQSLKTIFPIIDASTREPLENPVEKVITNGETTFLSNHTTLIAKNGVEHQIADSAAPIRDSDGGIYGMVLIFNDITEQYQLREAAVESKRDLQAIMDHSAAVIYIKDTKGIFTFINHQFEDLFHIRREDIVGKTLHDIFPKNIADVMQFNDKAVLEVEHALESEEVAPLDDGLHTYVSIKFPLWNSEGKIYAVCGISTDITSRKEMEDEIRSSEQHLKLYRDQTPLATIEWNADFQVKDWNIAAEKMFGYTLDEVRGHDFLDLMLPKDTVANAKQVWHDLMAQTGGTKSINENLTKHGQVILCEWHNTSLVDASGKVIGAASIVRDITAEHQTRQALLYKEQEQREILNTIVDAVITIDEFGIILTYNKAAETLFGYTTGEIVGQSVKRLMSEFEASQHKSYLQHYLETGEERIIGVCREVKVQHKNKGIFPIRLSVAELPSGTDSKRRFVGSCIDLSLVKQQEEQLRRSQKMEALGKLTGGVAHDYNNVLGVILGYADLLKDAPNVAPQTIKYAQEIYHAAERGAKLTQKLLSFSRQKSTEATVLNINALLLEGQHMLEKTLTARIKLVYDLSDDLWLIRVDDGDLMDAILNMSINAMHAMKSEGLLTLYTGNKKINDRDARSLRMKAGDYVLFSITDTGSGMDEATKEKIFDPFFSTKGECGTGLGLSQVYGFVERSDALIKVSSEPRHGTRFTLYFPRCRESQGQDLETNKAQEVIDLRGKETILIVDDESALLNLSCEILSQQGYNILCAHSGKQALEILAHESIDLLFSDIIMPEMDGYQLASMVQKKYPDVKIQLVSGYSNGHHVNMVDDSLHQNLIYKPFNTQSLLKKIRVLLDKKDG